MESEAANLLLRAALANAHLLKPHMDALAAYCHRERINQWEYLETMIAAQFRLGKGARK
jgi:hypothetical protein